MSVLSDMFYKHTVFHQMKTAHRKNFDTNNYFCQKCELMSYKVVDYKHNIYNRDLFLFYFYTVQCKKSIPRSECFPFSLSLNVSFKEVPSHNTQMNYTCVSSESFSFHCFQFYMSII